MFAAVGFSGLFMLAAVACGGSPDGGGSSTSTTTPGTVDQVLASAPPLTAPPATGEKATSAPTPAAPETMSDGSTWQCTVTQYHMEDDPEQFVTVSPGAAVIWPGSMLQGKTVESGTPEPIALKRGGGTILMNLLNSGTGTGAKSYQVHLDEMTQGNVIDAQNQILSNNVGATPAAFSFEYQKVDSETQMALSIGVDVSWMSGDASASLKFSSDKHYTRYLVKLTQQYYTMVYETPTSPSDLLDSSVTADDVARYVQPGNPATYISSVTSCSRATPRRTSRR
jgi:thiol-activated cytolysin